MCGINGIVTKKDLSHLKLKSAIQSMNQLIFHRGPDDEGIYTQTMCTSSIAMGMRRLSIIDLVTGKQPMSSKDGNVTIVFNGEIYNFKELKLSLESQGVKFNTKSDTEVILRLYETFGIDAFNKLDGMFAFSIHDIKKKLVYIVRDFFGEKPLYYYHGTDGLIWASELKSIIDYLGYKPKISTNGLNLYMRLTYIPAPFTIYEGIKKLESNSILSYNIEEDSLKINELPASKEDYLDKPIDFNSAKKRVFELVNESVSSRSTSDVPLGTFLSGGVDSSIVSLCLANNQNSSIDTFSIGFKQKSYDESDKSKLVAEQINSNHHEFIIDEKDLKEDVSDILLNFDEPFADSSALPTFLVSKKTREHVTVALTGDGGDEVFGGYNKYYMGKLNSRYTSIIPKQFHQSISKLSSPLLTTSSDKRGKRYRLKKLINSFSYNNEHYWEIISLGFSVGSPSQFLRPEFIEPYPFSEYKHKSGIKQPKSLSDFRNIDKLISLEGDMLVKVDRTSMLNSLECRAPFLNRKLWNYAGLLPENYLLKGWNKKYILKEAFKNHFPKGFLEKSKSGFGVPVGDWLKTSLRKELLKYSETKNLNQQSIFNTTAIQKLVEDHISGKMDNTFKVWTFYCFQKWYYNVYEKIN